MSHELRKPITDNERADFIVEYNHQNGLRIEDTEYFLFALEANEIMGEKEIKIDVPDYETVEEEYPEPVLDEEGNQVYDTQIIEKEVEMLDEDGNPVLDDNGEPIYETIEEEVQVPRYETKTREVEIEVGSHKETIVVPYPVVNPEWEVIELEQVKEAKILENDKARDEALNAGVTYKNILFDSDTDQKINLLAIISKMQDEDLITWYGMNNDALDCTKADLIAIGALITNLHCWCWEANAFYKVSIASAESVDELDEITIDYTMPDGTVFKQENEIE